MQWQTPPDYPHALVANSGSCEFWLRRRLKGGYRLLTFRRGYLLGGTDHRDLAAGKKAAEQIDTAFRLDARA